MEAGTSRTSGLIMNHSSKVLDPKLGFIAVLGRNVVAVQFVLRVQLIQHGGVCSLRRDTIPHQNAFQSRTFLSPPPPLKHLGELALLVDEGDDVHGFVGDHVQSVLVVGELNVLPADVLQVVLLLLQFENVANEELLQILVGEVDAQLLEAARKKRRRV